MAQQLIRSFNVEAANQRVLVHYDPTLEILQDRITTNRETLNAGQPVDPAQVETPTDGLLEGDVLVAAYCDAITPTTAVTVYAIDAAPWAAEARDPTASACAVPVVECDLSPVGVATGMVVDLTGTTTSHGPWRVSTDQVVYQVEPPSITFTTPGSKTLYFRDAGGCALPIVVYVADPNPGGGGGGGSNPQPGGEVIDTFDLGDETVGIYFLDSRTPQLLHWQTPRTQLISDPLTGNERGRNEDAFIKHLCVETTKYSFFATLSAPYARLETEENSLYCGYEAPECDLAFDGYSSTPTTAAGSATGSISATILSKATLIEARIAPKLASGQPGAWSDWVTVTDHDHTFTGLVAGTYFLGARDNNLAGCQIQQEVSVAEFARAGCRDPAATNYDPLATTDGVVCAYAPVLKTAIFSVPITNSLQFVIPPSGYAANGPFRVTANTLLADQKHVGVNQPDYCQKVAKADVLTVQFKSNFAAHVVQLRSKDTGALVRTFPAVRILKGLNSTATFDGYLRPHVSDEQARVYFKSGLLPSSSLQIGQRITIAGTQSTLDGTYPILTVSEDPAQGVPYLVINAAYGKTTVDERLNCTVTTTYDLQKHDTWETTMSFGSVAKGCYYILLTATDPALGSARAVSEPIEVASEHPGTLLIAYRNYDNAYDINYTHGIEHRVRVVARLHEPDTATTKDILITSDNRTLLLASTVRLQERLKTFQLPPYLHIRLGIAFAHDLVRVEGVRYVAEGKYERTVLEQYGLWNGSVVLTQFEALGAGNSDDLGDLNTGQGIILANEGYIRY
jgi:hypothetical protein